MSFRVKNMAFDDTKQYGAEKYTGMSVGSGHHWEYTKCDVKEMKVTPSEWQFTMESIKRRIGGWKDGRYWKATPNRQITSNEAPIGAHYRWMFLGVQDVVKIEADAYHTIFQPTKLKIEPSNAFQKNQVAARITELATNAIEAYCTTPEQKATELYQTRLV